MPGYRVHLSAGLVTWIVVWQATAHFLYPPTTADLLFGLGLGLVGSIFPDIDVRSKMQRLFYLSAIVIVPVALWYHAWQFFFCFAAAAFLVAIVRHRTITHQSWFLVLMPGFFVLYLGYFNQASFNHIISYYLFFVAGALSHVFLDKSITKFKKLTKRY
ncbi:metal-dependent hydrolase [Candidatus Babeliales bacterium]|nr:metal-dependent hydrolase [Candidatus Babeliales bacterium]